MQQIILRFVLAVGCACLGCDSKELDTRFLARPTTVHTPVGIWSTWSAWSACSVTCSSGTRFRARHCESDSGCKGNLFQSQECTQQRCMHIVDGQWNNWNAWQSCSATCGDGVKSRARQCNNPTPQDGGKPCNGKGQENANCKVQGCPIDGGWSSYTARPCSKTCGLGVAVFIRQCTQPAPQFGGKECEGSATKFASCNEAECIIDGQWSSWSLYTDCGVVCGDGHIRRERSCTAPPPHKGKNCTGESRERSDCNNGVCPSDIKICDKQKISTVMSTNSVLQSCTSGNDVTVQVDLVSAVCSAPRNDTLWKLGLAIADNCEAIPVRVPIGLVHRQTKEKKYGILLDCYQEILEFATQTCDLGIVTQTVNLTTTTDMDYHLLLW